MNALTNLAPAPMSQPQLRRRYEMLSFTLNAAIPIALVAVSWVQHVKLAQQAQDIEYLRAEIATIRLNSANPPSRYDLNGSVNPTTTPTTANK